MNPTALGRRWPADVRGEAAFGAGPESADGQGLGDGFERPPFSVDAPDELDEAADEREDGGDGVGEEDVPAVAAFSDEGDEQKHGSEAVGATDHDPAADGIEVLAHILISAHRETAIFSSVRQAGPR
ncbi:MAG: hypothetical protein ACRDQD_20405 [Nocardioidaceae bacterium]